jgi:hypothetical protein
MTKAEQILERAMELTRWAVNVSEASSEDSANYASAARDLVSAYSRVKDVEFAQTHIDMYKKTQGQPEEDFQLPGEGPLVNPNN